MRTSTDSSFQVFLFFCGLGFYLIRRQRKTSSRRNSTRENIPELVNISAEATKNRSLSMQKVLKKWRKFSRATRAMRGSTKWVSGKLEFDAWFPRRRQQPFGGQYRCNYLNNINFASVPRFFDHVHRPRTRFTTGPFHVALMAIGLSDR